MRLGIAMSAAGAQRVAANLVSNGGFASGTGWTPGTSWSISGGVATHVNGSLSDLSQTVSLTAGKTYAVTYTISNRTGGTLQPRFNGGTQVQGVSRNTNGTFTEYLTAVTGNNTLSFTAAAAGAYNLDDVSLTLVA